MHKHEKKNWKSYIYWGKRLPVSGHLEELLDAIRAKHLSSTVATEVFCPEVTLRGSPPVLHRKTVCNGIDTFFCSGRNGFFALDSTSKISVSTSGFIFRNSTWRLSLVMNDREATRCKWLHIPFESWFKFQKRVWPCCSCSLFFTFSEALRKSFPSSQIPSVSAILTWLVHFWYNADISVDSGC